jgi:hypothetical protein
MDPSLGGEHGRQFTAAPLRVDRAVLKGVLIDETIEMLFSLPGEFRGATRARTIHQSQRAVVGKAMDPLAQRGIGKLEGVGDGLEALAFDNVAHGLGTPEDTSFFGLLQESVEGRQGIIGKVQFESPHRGALHNKILQKYENSPLHIV